MPQITAIKPQVKDPNRFSVFLGGSYGFSLTANQLADSRLQIGQELSDDEIEDWTGHSIFGKALQSAYRLLSYRARSRYELQQRLERKGFDGSTTDLVLERLTELGLINDENFATSSVSQPQATSRSRRRLQQELRKKGIDREVADQTIGGLGEEHDLTAIQKLVDKKINQPSINRTRLENYLQRQGFSYGLIKRVLDQEFIENH